MGGGRRRRVAVVGGVEGEDICWGEHVFNRRERFRNVIEVDEQTHRSPHCKAQSENSTVHGRTGPLRQCGRPGLFS